MTRAVVFLVLGLAAAAFAHEGHSEDSSHYEDHSTWSTTKTRDGHHGDDDTTTTTFVYTGPTFNPTDALNFGSTTSVSFAFDHTSTTEDSPKSTSAPAPASSPSSSSTEDRSTSSATITTSVASSSAAPSSTISAPAQVSTGAAYSNMPEIVGAIAGVVGAGLALV